MKEIRLPFYGKGYPAQSCPRIQDLFFFLSFGLFMLTSILSTSFFYRYFMGRIYMWLQVAMFVLLIAHEYVNDIRKQNWKCFAAIAVLGIISLIWAGGNLNRLVTFMFAYAYCARNVSFKKLLRMTLQISLIVAAVVIFSGYIGIIDNVVICKNGRVREYLGFRYALFLPGILLNVTAIWMYLRRRTAPIDEALALLAANWFVYIKTDSRISFVLAVVLIAAAVFLRFLPKIADKLQPIWGLMASSFVLFGAFSMVMTWIYDGNISWMRKLNSVLESRLSLGKRSLESYGFKLFGQKIEWLGNGLNAFGQSVPGTYTYVDCLYVKILQRYGLVFLLLLVGLMTWGMIKLWKKKHYHILLILASVAAHCVLDDLSFALHYNTFWIPLALVFLNPAALDEE